MSSIVNFASRMLLLPWAQAISNFSKTSSMNCFEYPLGGFMKSLKEISKIFKAGETFRNTVLTGPALVAQQASANKFCETYKAFAYCQTSEECENIINKLNELMPPEPIWPVLAGSLADTVADSIVANTDKKRIIKYGLGVTATITAAAVTGAPVAQAVGFYCLHKATHKVAAVVLGKLYGLLTLNRAVMENPEE